MKKIILFALLGNFLNIYSQNYDLLIKKADSCYEAKNYKISTDFFAKAFKENPESKKNYYNAACSASLANEKNSAIKWLEIAINNGFENVNHIKSDADLDNIKNEKKFIQIISKLQKKIDLVESQYDKPLQKELLQIFKDDQEIRLQYVAAEKKYGYKGNVIDSLGQIMDKNDSSNLIKIQKILDEKGWVGKDKIGQQANQTLFLVIQHADLAIQKKYLPMMKDAVNKGNANAGSLALLEDRIALREGRKQIYGSQIGTNITTKKQYVLPLEDPDNVDIRRKKVGLNSLSDYVKSFDIIWDLEKYKKDLPEIEEMNRPKKQ